MIRSIIIDTSPLVAFIDKSDNFHNWTIEAWKRISIPLLTCEAVISEACFLLKQTHGGQQAVMRLLKANVIKTRFELSEELNAVDQLMQRYQSVPMSFADACLVRMSELMEGSSVFTIDSDFHIYRKNRREMIDLIIPD
ncbi:MAG: PIN domain-containing protein [Microcystis aeruginosa S11-01]|jgi:predicted nucleic acid-binding protein|nr:PIN domain-containing protein [Microcystis aeruginosa S11-05]NCR50513.1 PIN domain-containing protein [Microcystis aeruginosa S11-01]